VKFRFSRAVLRAERPRKTLIDWVKATAEAIFLVLAVFGRAKNPRISGKSAPFARFFCGTTKEDAKPQLIPTHPK
jgi:hypothetical protein